MLHWREIDQAFSLLNHWLDEAAMDPSSVESLRGRESWLLDVQRLWRFDLDMLQLSNVQLLGHLDIGKPFLTMKPGL